MKQLLTLAVAVVALATTAPAQTTVNITNSVLWDQIGTAASWDVTLATNKARIPTNGYTIPATAVIATDTVTAPIASITNLFPLITNGIYSVFIKSRDPFGMTTVNSTNFVFNMVIPLQPAYNLRLQ